MECIDGREILRNIITNRMTHGVVPLFIKDPTKKHLIENLSPIILFNSELKILTIILAKRLAVIVGSIVMDAKSFLFTRRSIHDNLQLMRYIVEWLRNRSGFEEALLNFHPTFLKERNIAI